MRVPTSPSLRRRIALLAFIKDLSIEEAMEMYIEWLIGRDLRSN